MSGQRAMRNGVKRDTISLRVLPAELGEIDQRARVLGLTRTDYMIRAALRQPLGDEDTVERLEGFEERLGRLEERVYQFS